MKSSLLFGFTMVACLRMQGQWTVPVPVVLDGPDPDQRQITGLAAPATERSGANMDADRYRSTTYATAQGSNDLVLHLSPALSAYAPGMRITMIPAEVNSGSATLNIDGLGAVPVHRSVTEELDSADLRPGIPVDLVYDGSVFQVSNQLYPACPSGFKALGREACVEAEDHDVVNWFNAGLQCASRGFRLCSFAEWMQACLMPNGILPNISDYEWVDSAANMNNSVKTVGLVETTLVPDCKSGGHRLPTQVSRFRCCSDR